jgi:xylose isomerase
MFSQFIDRYATDAYGPTVNTLQAIARAGEVGSLTALDVNYPFGDGITVKEVKAALTAAGLRAIAITPHIYTREFCRGSFTNPDPAVRRKAIDLGLEAIDIARTLGADYVKFWPGQDGYDYPFQADYLELWDLSVQGVRTVAASDPKMQFAIEYKAKEPRAHLTFSTAARTLLAIEQMKVDNVGVVMDLGHSLLGRETPAEELLLLSRSGRLRSVEVNDNWREWDDDLAGGSIHVIETLEFLLAVRRIGWSKPILLDQFPFREDPVEAARRSIAMLKLLDSRLERIDLAELRTLQSRQDSLAAQALVNEALFGS